MKSWCKVASNLDSHPRIRRAGRNGREVFLFALRRNAEPDNPVPGRVPAVMLEPWYVADQLMMSEAEAVTGVTAAVTAGLLVQEGDQFVIVGWESDWGKTTATAAERTAKWRESKKRDVTRDGVTSQKVTDVTRDVRDALDQIRGDEKRVEESKKPDGKPPGVDKAQRDSDRAAKIPVRAWGAADFFRDLVLGENPRHAMRSKPWSEQRGLRLEWADELRRLVDVDQRSWEEIGEMLMWLFKKQPSSKFKFVVQSPGSLRGKWDQIVAVRSNQTSANTNRAGGVSQGLLDMANGDA